MTLNWTAGGDFDGVVDTLESITLLRRGGDPSGGAHEGWRFSESSSDLLDSDGAIRTIDTTWQLPIAAEQAEPCLGDTIRDSAGVGSVIRSVDRLRGSTRWVCATRRAEVAPLRAGAFVLERPVYTSGPQGDELSGWRPIAGGLALVVLATEGEAGDSTHRAYSVEAASAEEGDRLRNVRGEEYLVVSTPQSPGLGDPHELELQLSDSSA